MSFTKSEFYEMLSSEAPHSSHLQVQELTLNSHQAQWLIATISTRSQQPLPPVPDAVNHLWSQEYLHFFVSLVSYIVCFTCACLSQIKKKKKTLKFGSRSSSDWPFLFWWVTSNDWSCFLGQTDCEWIQPGQVLVILDILPLALKFLN